MKKIVAIAACLAVLAVFTTSASAAEPGKISGSLLNKMGLSSAKVMTAQEGNQVRGSFAVTGGLSFARVNLGFASALDGRFHFATGGTGSIGGSNAGASVLGITAVAGGSAYAIGF